MIPDYLFFHLVFTVPVVTVLTVTGPLSNQRRVLSGLVILIPIALLYTIPWDSYLIRLGVWEYGPKSVAVTLWQIPLGEYVFIVLQTVLTGLWLARQDWKSAPAGEVATRRRFEGAIAAIIVGIVGIVALTTETTFYLGAILVWSAPVLVVQWAFDWPYLWNRRRTVLLGVLVPTSILCIADRAAIFYSIWQLSNRYTTGIVLFGLPVEEVVFFIVTNLFVVQGLILYDGFLEWRREQGKRTTSRESHKRSKAIQRQTGTTFYLATRLLPKRIRVPTYVLYAFCRTADDIVDDVNPPPPDEQTRALEQLRSIALGERDTTNPVLKAFAKIQARYNISQESIDAFVDSMAMDIYRDRYRTRDELETYIRGSGAAVGHMMMDVLDPSVDRTAYPYAAALGEAFQLTNFLRDVKEDVQNYDRIYLPETTLTSHGVSHTDVANLQFSPSIAAAVRDEIQRAEARYHVGVDGIRYLPEDCRFPVLVAAVLYASQHQLIREQGYDILSTTPTLSRRRRLILLVHTWVRWQHSDDPLTVFYQVTDFQPFDETVECDHASEVSSTAQRR